MLLDRFKEIKAEKERIEKVLQHYNNKIASLEEKLKVYERVQEQQKADEGKRKERLGKDRLYEIKLQIDEYIREIEQSLLKVGGLSEDERKHLGRMELTSLVDYIERAAK